MVEKKDFSHPISPTWCPGCGNYGILNAVKDALVSLGREPHQVLIVSGIGCSGKFPGYIRANGFQGIHGRALPVATGAKLANQALLILTVTGDGDGYGIGGNHFIHAARRNIDIVHIVHDNQVYGLTKGQFSPTSQSGFKTKTSPEGSTDRPLNPLRIALSAGATFVARGYSGELKHLTRLITEAARHRGYALIDTLQPCVNFNYINTYKWFNHRVYKLEDSGHDSSSWEAAMTRAGEWGEKIPLGIFYRAEGVPALDELIPALSAGPLVTQDLNSKVLGDFEKIKKEFV